MSTMTSYQAEALNQHAAALSNLRRGTQPVGTLMESPSRYVNEVTVDHMIIILLTTAAQQPTATIRESDAQAWIEYAKRITERLTTEGATP